MSDRRTPQEPRTMGEPPREGDRPARGEVRRRRPRDDVMVPEAAFSSYYGRNVVKPAPWGPDVPAYLFLGGLAAGSGLIAAGAELTGRRELRRNARAVSLLALGGSGATLVRDLGRPERFLNMMRTVKLTSPMSVGSWILTGFSAFTGAATAAEVGGAVLSRYDESGRSARWISVAGRLASIGAGAFGPPLAAYTAVLLSDTATPTWHAAYRELPFVFVGSALAASGGAAMVTTSVGEAGPARRVAVAGAVLDLGAHEVMSRRMARSGIEGEPLHTGRPGRMLRAAQACVATGAVLTLLGGRRRPVAMAAGAALAAGSAVTRFGVVAAGISSAKDPRYTVEPQRARLAARLEVSSGLPPRSLPR